MGRVWCVGKRLGDLYRDWVALCRGESAWCVGERVGAV